jgi:membrane protein
MAPEPSSRSWLDAFKRTGKAFKGDQLGIWAAALTYFGVLSIFPALLVLVSVLGLIGGSVTDTLLDNLEEVAPGPAQEIFSNAIRNLEGARGASTVAFVIGIVSAIWAASGYVDGFMSASNAIYDVEEGRPMTKTLPVRIGLTVVLMVLAGVIAFAVTLTGGLAKAVGDVVGLGGTAVDVWGVAKWPVLLLLVSLLFAVLYWGAPNVKVPFRLISPGSLLAVVGWVVASVVFAFYVGNFGSYNKTYGALAGPIVFLLWLWISNICVLLGAELNAELEDAR